MKHSLFAKTALFFLSLVHLTITCSAQSQSKAEDLLRKFKQTQTDTAKVNILQALSIEYIDKDNIKALKYAEEALRLAHKSQEFPLISNSLYRIAVCYQKLNRHDSAKVFYERGLEVSQKIKYRKGTALNLAGKGRVSFSFGKYDEALKYLFQALKIAQKYNYAEIRARALGDIGAVYLRLKNFDRSMQFLKESLELSKKIKSDVLVASNLSNIGSVYGSNSKFDKAQEYFLQALSIYERIGNRWGTAQCLSDLATNSYFGKEYRKAIRYSEESIDINRELRNAGGVSKNYVMLGSCFEKLGDFKTALKNYHEAVRAAEESKAAREIQYAYQALAYCYGNAKQYEKALILYKKYTSVKDSILNRSLAEKSAEMAVVYETEKKDNSIRLLAKENSLQKLRIREKNLLIYGLAALALVTAALLLLLYHRRRLIADRKAAELEQKLLRMRMNPHFIFNALNAVRSFMDEHKTEEAADYLIDFAGLMRSTLESSFNDYVPLEEEMESLKQYLRLQKIRFKDKLHFDIQTDPSLNTEEIAVPPMLAQPFIENAVEHGVRGSEEKVNIRVRFSPGKEKNTLLFETQDDRMHGERQSPQTPNLKKHVSRAVRITEERLKGFNKKNKKKVTLEILRPTEGGTKVIFHIPFVYS